MATPSDEDFNGYKLIKLLDEATNTLKLFLLKSYKNDVTKFHQALKSVEVKIRKTLRPDQIKIVFPEEGETKLDKYDISLIYCLLRVLQKVRKPKTGWYDQPLVTDKSDGACVVRIYISRNSLCHGRLKKTSVEFQKYLDDIGKSMITLGCDIKIINDIINITSIQNAKQIVFDKQEELRKLEDEHEELLQKMEEMDSCFGKDVWFGVMPLIPTFVGRKKEVEWLHENMLKMRHGILATVLSGLPGTGKTTLAQYYCYEYCESYSNNVVWLNASTIENLNSSFLTLGKHLNLIDKQTDQHTLDIEILVTRIYKLFAKTKVLFVFDNCEDVNEVSKYLPSNLPPSVKLPAILITSQKSNWGQRFLEKKMNKLSTDESIEFINNTVPKELIENVDDVTKLSDILDGYPLALQQSAAYIKHFSITVSQYIFRFQTMDASSQSMLRFPSEDIMYRYQLSTALELLLNRLYESDDLSTEIIKIISLLDGSKIDASLFQNYLIKKGDFNESVLLHLEELSLIRLETNHLQRTRLITVHSLVQKFILESLKVSNTIDYYVEQVFVLFKHIIPNDRKRKVGDWNFGNVWVHHISYMFHNMEHSLCFSEKISELKREITDALRQKGNEDIAIKILLTIEEHYKTLFGDVNKQVLDTLTLLQGCYCSLRHWNTALDSCTRAEEMALLLYKNNSDKVSTARHNRALCLSKLGQSDEAIKIYRKLFSENQLSTIHMDGTVITAINLSCELERQHKYNEALEIEDHVLAIVKEMPSYQTNVEYYQICERRAGTLNQLGRKQEAQKVLEVAIEEGSLHLGHENMKTLHLKENLAFILIKNSNYEAGLDILLEISKIMENIFKNNHPLYLDLQCSLANCYRRMGRLVDAIGIYEVVKGILENKLDPEHNEIRPVQLSMAHCYFSLGQYRKALDILYDMKDIEEDLYGKNHLQLLGTNKDIAYYLYMIGDYNKAMTIRKEIKNLLISMHGEHIDIYAQNNFIALSLEKMGHFEEALDLHEIVYTNCQKIHGSNYPLTQGSLFNRAICWLAVGRLEEALDFFLCNVKQTSEMKDLSSFFAKYYLLATYVELGRITDAMEMLELTLNLGYKLFDSKHVYILRAIYQNARCEFHNGNIIGTKSKCQHILENVGQLAKSHLLVVGTNILIARCLHLDGEKEDAIRICNKVIENSKDVLVSNHPVFTPAYNILKSSA